MHPDGNPGAKGGDACMPNRKQDTTTRRKQPRKRVDRNLIIALIGLTTALVELIKALIR